MLDLEVAVEQEEARLRQLHPTPSDIPSCLNAFDDFLACGRKRLVAHLVQSLTYCIVIRNQIKSLYRFGHRTTDCDRKFNDFKFCLTLKIMHPEERREAWIRRRAEWWAYRRLGNSSENVWDIRKCVSLPLLLFGFVQKVDREPIQFPKPVTEEMMRNI